MVVVGVLWSLWPSGVHTACLSWQLWFWVRATVMSWVDWGVMVSSQILLELLATLLTLWRVPFFDFDGVVAEGFVAEGELLGEIQAHGEAVCAVVGWGDVLEPGPGRRRPNRGHHRSALCRQLAATAGT